MVDRHAPRPFQIGRPHFGYGSNMWPPWLWLDAKSARRGPTRRGCQIIAWSSRN